MKIDDYGERFKLSVLYNDVAYNFSGFETRDFSRIIDAVTGFNLKKFDYARLNLFFNGEVEHSLTLRNIGTCLSWKINKKIFVEDQGSCAVDELEDLLLNLYCKCYNKSYEKEGE